MFIEYQKEPLAEYHDKSPLAIQYFGFASYDNAPNKYFYNCEGKIVRSDFFSRVNRLVSIAFVDIFFR